MPLLTTGNSLVQKESWRMVKGFHMGDFVKGILDQRHINRASMAKGMGVTPQAVMSYLNSKVITNEVLMRMSEALMFNIYKMVLAKQAELINPSSPRAGGTQFNEVSDPIGSYGHEPPANHGPGFSILISPGDYSVEDMVRVLRFLDGIPLKQNRKRTGA